MRHTGTQTLQTPRLRLRRFSVSDAPAMYENWAADPAVTRFLRFSPHENVQVSRDLLAEWERDYAKPDHYIWAITALADGTLMGSVGVSPGEHDPAVLEPGYCMGRAFWGSGFMTEALGAVLAHMFDAVGVDKLACSHALDNPASGRVMTKNGFVYTRDDIYHKFDGTPMPCHCYELTKEQYEPTKRNT